MAWQVLISRSLDILQNGGSPKTLVKYCNGPISDDLRYVHLRKLSYLGVCDLFGIRKELPFKEVSKNGGYPGYPNSWMVCVGKSYEMNGLGVPLFLETHVSMFLHVICVWYVGLGASWLLLSFLLMRLPFLSFWWFIPFHSPSPVGHVFVSEAIPSVSQTLIHNLHWSILYNMIYYDIITYCRYMFEICIFVHFCW